MLKIDNLYKEFRKLIAVNGVSFTVDKGETVVLMGPSGCGKSTTIRSINRLIEPEKGSVLFDGIDILRLTGDELRDIRKRIGFVFQHFNLIGRLTALDNVMLGLVMGGMDKEAARSKALEAMRKVGLENHADHKPSEMSGGQQQRVGIARALAFEP